MEKIKVLHESYLKTCRKIPLDILPKQLSIFHSLDAAFLNQNESIQKLKESVSSNCTICGCHCESINPFLNFDLDLAHLKFVYSSLLVYYSAYY